MNLLRPLANLLPPALLALGRPATPACGEQEHRLAAILGISAEALLALRLGRTLHYRPFTVPKPDGRERRLLAPSPALKRLQRRLLRGYLAALPVHRAATAFYRGASTVTHARIHAGQAVVATLDLADFFERTSAARVRAFFLEQGWRGAALDALMRLCVYRGALPQGAPTSPCLSNLVNAGLDADLAELARRAGARYSRYGDDLAFSWCADDIPAFFEAKLDELLHAAGYSVQPRKAWRVWRITQSPELTGLTLRADGSVRAPASLVRRARKLRWLWWWRRDRRTAEQLEGYRGYFKMLD